MSLRQKTKPLSKYAVVFWPEEEKVSYLETKCITSPKPSVFIGNAVDVKIGGQTFKADIIHLSGKCVRACVSFVSTKTLV